jgi:hypothetical protein
MWYARARNNAWWFWLVNLKESGHLEDIGLDEDIIKMDLKNNMGGYGLDHLAQDRDRGTHL